MAGRAAATFGFHGVFNFPRFLDEAALVETADLLPAEMFGSDDVVELVAHCVMERRGAVPAFLRAWRGSATQDEVRTRLAPLLHPRELEWVMEKAW